MEMNSYEKIKDFIFKKLQDVNGILPKNKIQEEINNTRNLISTLGLKVFAQILSVEKVSILYDEDWSRMQRELETHFDVQMENGILIQGEEQQLRDNIWWTSKQKQKGDNYYWNRYKSYINKSLPPEVVKTIDVDTDIVMDNIEDPLIESFSRHGMVVGHVQSGKTGNYAALVCKAADAGYKFIVVVAGGINNLRNQTQERLNEAFVGMDKGVPVGVGKLGNLKKELLPVSLTTKQQDFNKQDANKNSQGLNFDNINSPIILVIKKQTNTLKNVIEWLENQYKYRIADHAMLLIDDESDYASINTKGEDNPTIINEKLRKLLSLFKKSVYVAYTATPYANIFIDHKVDKNDIGKDLFPKDFIYALSAPSNYFGARKIFLDTNKRHLIEIDKEDGGYSDIIPSNHKKNFELQSIPNSLYDAMRVFIINIAVRNLRNQGNKHNSMLIHATRFTMVHQQLSTHVENYITESRKDINAYGALPDAINHSEIVRNIKETYDSRYIGLEFSWETVLISICNIINTIVVREVHQSTSVPLEYREDRVTNAIVIGGTSLSRGYTLEGLSVSYFLRNTIYYDTLMQMGRWFGYRTGYEDLCRVYMTSTMSENFKNIIITTEELFDDFERMKIKKMTPSDFGLSVRMHPDSLLQVTARNKQKNAKDYYFEMKLDGHAKETSWLHTDLNINNSNLKAIDEIVKELQINESLHFEIGNRNLWRDIDKKIVIKFLDKFKVYSSDQFGLKSRMPIDFVKKYVQDIDTKWDIALYSGESKEEHTVDNISINKENRNIENRGQYYEIANRQVSSGNAEAIVFFDDSEYKNLGSNRKDIREKMKKPLLMLHILDGIEKNKKDTKAKELAAFGISFPGGIESNNETVILKINTVYIQNLLDEEESDD